MNTLVSKLQLLEHFCLLVNENMNIQDLTSRQLPRRGVGSLPWAINKYTSSQKPLTYDLSAISIDCPTIASTNLDSQNLVFGTYIPTNYADIQLTKPVLKSGSVFRANNDNAEYGNWSFFNPSVWSPGDNGYIQSPYPGGNLVPVSLDYTFSRLYFLESSTFTNVVSGTYQPQNLLDVMQCIAYDAKQAANPSFSVSSYFIKLTKASGSGDDGSSITVVPTRISLRKPTVNISGPVDTVVVDTLTYTDPYSTYNWSTNTGVEIDITYLYNTLTVARIFEATGDYQATDELIPSNGSIISFTTQNTNNLDSNSKKYISFNTSQNATDANFIKVIRILQNVPDLTKVSMRFTNKSNVTYDFVLNNTVPDKNSVPPSNRFYSFTTNSEINLVNTIMYKVKVQISP